MDDLLVTAKTVLHDSQYRHLHSSHRRPAGSTSTRVPKWRMEAWNGLRRGKSKRRVEEFDVAKGIGILLVLIGHNIPQGSLHEFIYSFHMALFLIVSGLVIRYESLINLKSIKEIVFKNRKLLVYFSFYSVIYILFDLVVRVLLLKSQSIHIVLWDIYQTSTFFGISVLWFISALFLAKVLASRILVNEFRLSTNIVIILFIFTLVGVVSYGMPSPVGKFNLVIYFPVVTIIRSLLMTAFVMIGYLLRPVMLRFIVLNRSYVGAMFCASLLVVNILFSSYTGIVDYHYLLLGNSLLTLLLGLTGSLGVLGVSSLIVRLSLISKVFVFFGDNSLFVMVTHEYFFLSGTGDVLIHLFHLSLTATETYLFRIFILLIIETFLIWLFSSKIEALITRLTNKTSNFYMR